MGLLGVAGVVLGVATAVYTIAIIAGFAAAAGMFALSWREVHESLRS